MSEIWKDVKDYEGLYQVSSWGRLKSLARNDARGHARKEKLLKTPINAQGYESVNLYKNGLMVNVRVHQLVAQEFIGYIRDGFLTKIVDHIDNNKLNNRADNLQLVTPRFNSSKDVKNKTSKYTGVCFVSRRKKWQAQIKYLGVNIFLGHFDSQEDARDAYNHKLKELLCV